MIVRTLRLYEFRNYASAALSFADGLNVFVGKNAQGKTNLLEAVYYAGSLRSFRSSKETDLIRWGAREARVDIEFTRDELLNQLQIKIPDQGKRSACWNEQPVKKLTDLVGRLMTVSFITQDLLLVKGDPADRRRFLDNELSNLNHRYFYSFFQYRRCLEQRNKVLKLHAEGRGGLETLPEWSHQLAKYGSRLFMTRSRFLQDLNLRVSPVHQALTGDSETVQLSYLPGISVQEPPETEEAWQQAFEEAIHKVQKNEIQRATTLLGPHRDDFQIVIDGKDARQFASQGQQRTCALGLKLAELTFVEAALKEPPIVLLDDVFSDLDPERRKSLMAFLEPRSQTFITCTELASFQKKTLKGANIYHVQGGSVSDDA